MLTLGAMLAITDALLRLPAADAPSALCAHYAGTAEGTAGRAFAVDTRYFEIESERGHLVRPEFAAARARLLDYFRSTTTAATEARLLFRFEARAPRRQSRRMCLGPDRAAPRRLRWVLAAETAPSSASWRLRSAARRIATPTPSLASCSPARTTG